MKQRSIGFLSLLIAGFLLGSYGIWIRVLNTALSTYQQIGLRYLLGAIGLFVIIRIRRIGMFQGNVSKVHLILYLLSIPFSFVLFNFAMLQTKLSVATVGFYLGTIFWGYLIGWLIFKERINWQSLISSLFALFGLVLVMYPLSLASLNWGFLFGVGSGILYGVASMFKKHLKGKIAQLWLVEIGVISTVIIMVPLMMIEGTLLPQSLSLGIIGVAALFALIALTAEFLTIVGFQNFNLNLGSIVLAGEIVFAGIFGYLLYQERLTGAELGGLGLICVAIIFPNITSAFTSAD